MLKKIIDFVHESYKSIVYHTPKEKLNNSEIEKIIEWIDTFLQ